MQTLLWRRCSLVREDLKLVCSHLVLIKEYMVVGRTARPLQPGVADQEEVVLSWMGDARVHDRA